MKFYNFASSSAGNCYWLELERASGAPVRLLIEAGITYKEILKKSAEHGLNILDLNAVLITHNHADHFKGAKDLQKRGFRIYGNGTVCSSFNEQLYHDHIKVIAPDTYVIPFEVEHDAPDPLGFLLFTDNTDPRYATEKVLFVADCKYWKADLSWVPFDYIIIEANYDGQTLHHAYRNAIETANKPEELQYRRIFNAHMSIHNCCQALGKLNLSKCKSIYLIHLSDRNANEYKFKKEVERSTKIPCFVCGKYGGGI